MLCSTSQWQPLLPKRGKKCEKGARRAPFFASSERITPADRGGPHQIKKDRKPVLFYLSASNTLDAQDSRQTLRLDTKVKAPSNEGAG